MQAFLCSFAQVMDTWNLDPYQLKLTNWTLSLHCINCNYEVWLIFSFRLCLPFLDLVVKNLAYLWDISRVLSVLMVKHGVQLGACVPIKTTIFFLVEGLFSWTGFEWRFLKSDFISGENNRLFYIQIANCLCEICAFELPCKHFSHL